MKTEPGHSGAPEGGPLADAATTRSPPLPSAPTGPQAPKTAPRLIDQEHNKEAAEAASAERARLRAQIKGKNTAKWYLSIIQPIIPIGSAFYTLMRFRFTWRWSVSKDVSVMQVSDQVGEQSCCDVVE